MSAVLSHALGVKEARDGALTLYSRVALDSPEVSVAGWHPFRTDGRQEWVLEYTRKAGKPVELILRTAIPEQGAEHVTDVAARLDLRDPANMAVARLNSNGGLDTTFSTDGKDTLDFGGTDIAYALAIDYDDNDADPDGVIDNEIVAYYASDADAVRGAAAAAGAGYVVIADAPLATLGGHLITYRTPRGRGALAGAAQLRALIGREGGIEDLAMQLSDRGWGFGIA